MGRRIYFVHAQATVLVVCGKQSCMTVKIQCLADIQVQLWPAVLLLKAKSTNSQYRRIGRRNSLFSQMATSYSLAFSKTARSDSGQLGIELFRPGLREVHFDLGGLRMQRSRFTLILSVALSLLLICCVTAVGQVLKGSISGTVTDPQGAIVANAQVWSTNIESAAQLTATPHNAGAFQFNLIPTGTYKVDIIELGFKSLTQTNIPMNSGRD